MNVILSPVLLFLLVREVKKNTEEVVAQEQEVFLTGSTAIRTLRRSVTISRPAMKAVEGGKGLYAQNNIIIYSDTFDKILSETSPGK